MNELDRDCLWTLIDADGNTVCTRPADFKFLGCETFAIDFEEDFEIKAGDRLEIRIDG